MRIEAALFIWQLAYLSGVSNIKNDAYDPEPGRES